MAVSNHSTVRFTHCDGISLGDDSGGEGKLSHPRVEGRAWLDLCAHYPFHFLVSDLKGEGGIPQGMHNYRCCFLLSVLSQEFVMHLVIVISEIYCTKFNILLLVPHTVIPNTCFFQLSHTPSN